MAAIAAYRAANTEPLLQFEQAHPDACRRVRYEDLASRPDQVRAEIASFLSLDLDEPAEPHVMSDGLRLVPEGDETAADAQIPFNWIPPPLLTVVNQLMVRLGYPPVPAAGSPGVFEAGVEP